MCGICGKVAFAPSRSRVRAEDLREMMAALHHRGPDDRGMYLSDEVGLGHTRLSIIDLTTGQQPMSNEDGRVQVVFNGEIYNYRELREFLLGRGHQFASASDTEVIVHLYEEKGTDCFGMLRGMFAIALWDEGKRTLILARDRVGIKPLYYLNTLEGLLFGSEIKAILANLETAPDVDILGVDRFFTYHYIPGDRTLFKGIRKLPPGHYMTVKNGEVKLRQYWDLSFAEPLCARGEKEYSEELLNLLRETVGMHMIADVPVGVLLSGGVDSSAMLSFATEFSSGPISTFTIGFEGQEFADERPYARLVAERYGCKHYEATITAESFRQSLPLFIHHMEEPVCEPPAIALHLITKLAREHVKVLISGEGGDEAFAGYQNYRNIYWMERCKKLLGPGASPMGGLFSRLAGIPGFGRLQKFAPLMKVPFKSYYYSRTADPFHSFNALKPALYTGDFQIELAELSAKNHEPFDGMLENVEGGDVLAQMLYIDSKTWLPDDLLVKADKMTMANSVELRVPLLDHHILEFAAQLPRRLKLRGLTTKYLLKKTLANRVPAAILNRKKTGFPVPYESWMKNEMRGYVADMLTDPRAVSRGYFSPTAIDTMLAQNQTSGGFAAELFSLLVMELWQQSFVDLRRVPA